MDGQPPPYTDGEKQGVNTVLNDNQYNSMGQQTNYVNPSYPMTQPPPNYNAYGQPVPYAYPQPAPYGQPMGYNQPRVTVTQTGPPMTSVIMQSHRETPKGRQLNIAGTIIGAIVVILLIIGIGTDHWGKAAEYHWGVWRLCSQGICASTVLGWYISGLTIAIQAFAVLSVILCGIGFIFQVTMVTSRFTSKRNKATTAIVMYSLGVFFILLTVLLFGLFTPFAVRIGWSYWLTVVAGFGALSLTIFIGIARQECRDKGCVLTTAAPPMHGGVITTVS